MNESYIQNERSIHIFLLISLLLHISIMFYCIHYNNQQNSLIEKKQNFEQKTQNDLDEWVETKKGSSHNATPVYFRNDYQTVTSTTNDSHNTHDNNDNDNNDDFIEKNINATEPEPIIESPQPLEQHIDTQAATVQIQNIQSQQTKTQSLQRSSNSQATQYKPINSSIIKQHPQQKQLPSLAQLSQGVMNYVQKNGKYAVSMLGKKNGLPTDEQLKYERYLERLEKCLYNSWSINAHKQPGLSSQISDIVVYLELNKDGSIHNLKLVKSSGSRHMDLFVMAMMRDASSSFPPVPHYLPHNPFSTHCFINPFYHYK